MRRRLAAAFGFSVVAGALMVGTTGTAAAVAAPGDCTVPSEATVFYGPNVNGDYVVPDGIHALSVLAVGGGGAADTGNASAGGSGAQISTVLQVTPGDSLAITVGSTATGSAGGTSAGAASGGAGSEYSLNFGDGPVNYHSGGGGGASFVTLDSTTLVAAGGGGGGGYGGSLSGGDAGPATVESHSSATVFTGADGVTVDPTADPAVGGKGGQGGSSVPGAGGAVAGGYGAGPGLPGVGEIGGAAFVNGGFNVGAGGGGGGYQGGGGGGGGGYAGGGGAGSSYSAQDYDIVAATEEAQVLITALAPAFASADAATFQAGVPGSFLVCAPAVPTATITGAGALPDGITLVDNGDGTATISGTPAGSSLGEYPLALNASNANGSADQAFSLSVVAGPAVALSLTGPASADPGAPFDLGITTVDEFGNTATDFNGTVEVTYTDDGVPVEDTLVLTNGVGTLSVTLTHAGDHIIVVNSRTEGIDADSLTVTVTALPVSTTADTGASPTTGSTTAPATVTTESASSGSTTGTTTTAAAGGSTTTLPSTASTWATAPDLANTGAAVGPAIGVALGLLLAGAGALAYAGRRRDFTH